MTGATFTDVFPTSPGAMTVASPPLRNNGCSGNGQLRNPAGGILSGGDTGLQLLTGTIPANGSCVITVNVTASVAGVYTNTIPVGALSTSGGNNTVAASATLSVRRTVVHCGQERVACFRSGQRNDLAEGDSRRRRVLFNPGDQHRCRSG